MIKHVVEIGCTGHLSMKSFLEEADRIQVFEPVPQHVERIKEIYKDEPKVEVHQVALWKEDGPLKMNYLGQTSFVQGLESPVVANFQYQPLPEHELVVEGRRFDHYDDGSIEVIEIDAEGAEWYVLQCMKSRPIMISVEMEWHNYRNPFFAEIRAWMSDNRYAEYDYDKANWIYWRLGT
jgi:FkbM family methyltransferase